jgi:hypothetical protein
MSKKDNSVTHRTEVQGNENKREKNPVFNLSSKELTEAHRHLLGLGLKFVPTNQKIDMTELIADVRVITVFAVFRLLTDFVCLYNYEFGLSLCKIVRSSVILLLPLFRPLGEVQFDIFFFIKLYCF